MDLDRFEVVESPNSKFRLYTTYVSDASHELTTEKDLVFLRPPVAHILTPSFRGWSVVVVAVAVANLHFQQLMLTFFTPQALLQKPTL